tara:strand:- start:2894 stop:3565 length:672 start_codon:yes stop_codon:yes gene_type:complete
MKVLISGTNSGLGKWLSRQFSDCDKYNRDTMFNDLKDEYDLIIHCAADVAHSGWDNVSLDLFEDNVFLTRDLVKIPHKKFVYLSSIDEAKDSPYGVTKRISEIIVKDLSKNYLILRPSALLGKEMKKNTFQKIVRGENIALTPDTIMNYILYEDVLDAIKFDTCGTKVLRSNGNITIKEVVEIFGKDIDYGSIHYEVEDIVTDIDTGKSSTDNILLYKEKYEK